MIFRSFSLAVLMAAIAGFVHAQTSTPPPRAARLQPPASTTPPRGNASGQTDQVKEKNAPGKRSPDPAEMAKKMAEQREKMEFERFRRQMLQQLHFDIGATGFLRTWSQEGKSPEKEEKETEASDEQTRGVEGEKSSSGGSASEKEPEKKRLSLREQFQRELQALQKGVTLARWEDVRSILAKWPQSDAQTAYQRILESISQAGSSRSVPDMSTRTPFISQPGQMALPPQMSLPTSSTATFPFTADDLVGVIFAAPSKPDERTAAIWGSVARRLLDAGVPQRIVGERLAATVLHPNEQRPKWLDKPLMVDVLLAAGLDTTAERLLPRPEEALKKKDLRSLSQWSRIAETRFDKEAHRADLIQAWKWNREILIHGTDRDEETQAAIERAVALASKLDDELGRQWLAESFRQDPRRGRQVIAAIGLAYAQTQRSNRYNPQARRRSLELQKTAVEALVESATEQAQQWQRTLDLLANNWISEARIAYYHVDQARRILRYDSFGNPYYVDYNTAYGGRVSSNGRPIVIDDLLELAPSPRWRSFLSKELAPNLAAMQTRLQMKVGDFEPAYAGIASLASDYPALAKDLVSEFLERWRENHKLNSGEIPRNPFMVVYGFNQRAEGIPLTRSKQERNMRDLAQWVARLRKLNLGELDEDRLVAAFTDAHSVAEVYKLETIEQVFGPLDRLPVKLVAKLLNQMRSNLSGIWRDPRYQQAMKTKRRKKDIEREVERGYQVALEVADQALAKHPKSWQLPAARAALVIDRLNYRKEIEKSDSSFAELHSKAMSGFAVSAQRYAQIVATLPKEEWTVEPYQMWFYAALGSADIRGIAPDKIVDRSQIGKIAEALRSLPAPADRWHLAQFASSLYTRMTAINPGSKFLYLQAGFDIVGDHKLAREARRLYDYYRDLVTEIRFETVLDTEDVRVGHDEPFGVFVRFRHTKEIERETGGFAKYTTNQNQYYYAYNYGRPLADYRDRFEETARKALEDDFEVLSIVYNGKDAHSKATDEPGWRVTPYAYILLKAKGPHVDRLPPLKIDLDFTDTSGYVVLPIESTPLPLDASQDVREPSLPEDLTLVQTLDERQAEKGELILEIKATALGRIPPLEHLLKLDPPGFARTNIEDQGVTVSRFAEDTEETAVVCERLWLVHFRPDSDEQGSVPTQFVFGEPIVDVKESLYQRYVDEDLVAVDRVARLESSYTEAATSTWIGPVAGGITIILAIFAVWVWRRRVRRADGDTTGVVLPDQVNAFTVLGWLRHVDRQGLVSGDARRELEATIARLENAFFAESDGKEIDLEATLRRWAHTVTRS